MPRSLLAKPLGETQPVSGLTTGVMTVDKATLRQSLNQNQVTCKGIIGVALFASAENLVLRERRLVADGGDSVDRLQKGSKTT